MSLEPIGLVLAVAMVIMIVSTHAIDKDKKRTLGSIHRNIVGFTGILIALLVIQTCELFVSGKNITELLLALVFWVAILIMDIQQVKALTEV